MAEKHFHQRHSILILGGSYAGLRTAHRLLKRLPALARTTGRSYKVTLIANSERFWHVSTAPRALVQPWPHEPEDTFVPIRPGFDKYGELFEFVHGEVHSFDLEAKTATYSLKDGEATRDARHTFNYDTLVVALGAKSPSPLYSLHGSHAPTLAAFKAMHAALPPARSVLVVGGGTAGVETAGELASTYGRTKSITLLSGGHQLLPRNRADLGPRAQKYLEDMGVAVRHGVTMERDEDAGQGKRRAALSDGTALLVDIVILATGRKPNSAIVPAHLLDSSAKLVVDAHMRIPSAPIAGSAWAAGDISSTSAGDIVSIEFSMPVLEHNIVSTLRGEDSNKLKEFTGWPKSKEIALVPVGRSKAVGVLFGWWVPSWVVWLIKGRHMMFPKAARIVNGTDV